MHIIRMDIDRKHSTEHLQVGPLGCGLNAIYATAPTGSSTMTRFIKGLLFRGHSAQALNDDEEVEAIDGSLQWADATGHVRLMSYSGGSPLLPSRFVHSPLHPSERPLHSEDANQLRGLGNIFWEGDEYDGRWDDLRGDILGMVFCSPLGTVSPEKLWWAASRLGVHSPAKREQDEGYQRLKTEEQELLERLRHVEAVDHDRAWWSIERDRIAAELAHVQNLNQQASAKAERCCQPCSSSESEKLVSIRAEIARLRGLQQEAMVNEANAQFHENRTDGLRASSSEPHFQNVSLHNSSMGRSKWGSSRPEFVAERQRLQHRIDELLLEQNRLESEPSPLASVHLSTATPLSRRWDDVALRQQHAHAEEMIRRWDRRAQTHRRLEEVQSHLRTRSPYRRTTEGSLIPMAERFLRELTAGATRTLPPWAVEASYLNREATSPTSMDYYGETGYRRNYYDATLPSENTRQRKMVDLAIRLAIAQAAVPRIGRIPLVLDDSLSGFRGESLEQILHVLSGFSRDGRQLLVSTCDEYIARRVAAHGGTVSRMLDVLRYARPNYVLDGQQELGLHPSLDQSAILAMSQPTRPLRVVGGDSPTNEIVELNRQLTGLANEQASNSWWHPVQVRTHYRDPNVDRMAEPVSSNRKFHLHLDSPVQEAPGVTQQLLQRLNGVGVYRVSDLVRTPASQLGAAIRVDASMLDQIQRVAELMCGTPQLRAFDARVLVGCGITRPESLRSMPAAELVHRVESFLTSASGQDLLRGATSFEVARIRTWISDMRRSHSRTSRENVVPIQSEHARDRDRERTRRPRNLSGYETRPRIARSTDGGLRRRSRQSSRTSSTTPFVAATYSEPSQFTSATRNNSHRATSSSANSTSSRTASGTAATQWKFYLDIDSPVVDAPSIGPRMAERLAPLNIITVGDLVAANAESIATRLADRLVTIDVVRQWQDQAMFVCRVPNLRGHDAQLIVACGLSTAEELAASDATDLYNKVVRVASSKQGMRILRGSNAPDQAEVSDWIQWAQNCRAVRAA